LPNYEIRFNFPLAEGRLQINTEANFRHMKLLFRAVGKNHEPSLKPAIDDFTQRVNRYYPTNWHLIPQLKNAGTLSEAELRKKEGEHILQSLHHDDFLVVLDEKGKQLTSQGVSGFLQQRANESVKNLVFVIGGAFGLDEQVLQRARMQWSLSQLTFPHQLVRLILAEQIYRACTILRNEKYHHE